MKKIKIKRILTILLLVVTTAVNAQSLPNVQKASVRAPADIKIDGNATEWNNRFQAHNHATDIFYTLANDDNKLYLAVQAKNPDVINKILLSGITFTVNPSGKKNDKNSVNITFPVFDKRGRPNVNLKSKPITTKDGVENKMQADSFMRVINAQLTDKIKEIEVTGIKALADSLISIYNDNGIKTAALFDNQVNYTYELAVPLKYFNLSSNKFSYHIVLNGAAGRHAKLTLSRNGNMYLVSGSGGPDYAIPAGPQYMGLVAPTDFWGEYTLAK